MADYMEYHAKSEVEEIERTRPKATTVRGMESERIKFGVVDTGLIRDAVRELCIQAATVLPEDVTNALKEARPREENPLARDILKIMLENAVLARTEGIPICQDTGMVHVFLELGQDIVIEGGNLHVALREGVALGYEGGFLRKSVVRDPLYDRTNTGDNTPPVIHTEIVPGDEIRITVMPKGTGSENMSRLSMLTPAQGLDGVKAFVVQTVKEGGPNACPPLIVGVGVGGMMDQAAYLAKRALLRRVGCSSQDPKIAALEKELLDEINKLGIGPGALGGRTTALAVHIESFPTHMGALPVAVNLQCHAARRATRTIRGQPR